MKNDSSLPSGKRRYTKPELYFYGGICSETTKNDSLHELELHS
ncbi:hypothetical protein [Arundinibacter roseus]|nr:hypothetical protein [Arundinibacter roseus]